FDMALEGLDRRAQRMNMATERVFLEPFADAFMSRGPLSLQLQSQFHRSGKPLKDFLMDRWLRQKERLKS
ncbi:MAG: hypothetical protein ACE5GH_04525, partial [Fidelibacterota bacterium]